MTCKHIGLDIMIGLDILVSGVHDLAQQIGLDIMTWLISVDCPTKARLWLILETTLN